MERHLAAASSAIRAETVGNRLLGFLSVAERRTICTHLERVPLPAGTVLFGADAPVEHVYFPEKGVVSLVASLVDGAQIEVGMIGFEGAVGLTVLFGSETSMLETLVQVDCVALRMSDAAFRQALSGLPDFERLMLRYADAFFSQILQSAACNGRHSIEQRLARWILKTQDRVRSECFLMTHEFVAVMLGVRRPGVTQAIGALQRSGLVRHERSILHVLDRAGLERVSCECYAAVRRRNRWLFPTA